MMKSLPLLVASAVIGTSPMAETGPPALHNDNNPTCVVRTFCHDGSYLGVFIYDVDDVETEKKSDLRINDEQGVLIDRVIDDSPASKAGLLAQDVIVRFNGQRIEGIQQMIRFVQQTPGGTVVHLDIVRNGVPMSVDATIGTRDCDEKEFSFFMPHLDSASQIRIEVLRKRMGELGTKWDSIGKYWSGRELMAELTPRKPRLGIEMQPLTPGLAKYFGAEAGTGALISTVVDNSAAEKAGLEAGDIIVAIDGQKIAGSADVQRIIREKSGEIELTILRDKQQQTVRATLDGPVKNQEPTKSTNTPVPAIE